jgi:hypothetical protein
VYAFVIIRHHRRRICVASPAISVNIADPFAASRSFASFAHAPPQGCRLRARTSARSLAHEPAR